MPDERVRFASLDGKTPGTFFIESLRDPIEFLFYKNGCTFTSVENTEWPDVLIFEPFTVW